LIKLENLSKNVNQAAGEVVGASQAGKDENSGKNLEFIDFTKMSYTQAKKVEMDTQVKILDLESQLDKERKKIREIRKSAYNETQINNINANNIITNPIKAQEQNLRDIAAVMQNAPSVPVTPLTPTMTPTITPMATPAVTTMTPMTPTPAPRKTSNSTQNCLLTD
jgi:TolA-binding protein